MANIKVSVIVTIYNREKYLEKCVRSLLEQTLEDIEYVFVDDASTDGSVPLLEKIIEDYPNRLSQIKIIKQKLNGGRAVARQIGIDNVSGKYVIHADSDDWVDSNMYELLWQRAEKEDADIVGCNIMHEYDSGQSVFKQSYSNDMNENIRGLLDGKIFPSLCTSLTRTSLIKDYNIKFPQGLDTGEDLLFNIHLYLHANCVKGIDAASYHYRHTEDSGSYQLTPKSIDSVIEVSKRIDKLMKDTGKFAMFYKEIQYRKFTMKCALITTYENEDYNSAWLNLFPETHKYIWSYKQFSWKRRLELWLAAHNLFSLARMFQNFLKWQHHLRHP